MTEEDRHLLNWLAERIDAYGQVMPGHEQEAATIARRYASAQSKGLTVTPGQYLPRPAGKHLGNTSTRSLYCRRCDVTYPPSNYQCCVCQWVFRTPSVFERHQEIAEPAADHALEKLGLRMRKDGIWTGKPMLEAAKVKLRAQGVETGHVKDCDVEATARI